MWQAISVKPYSLGRIGALHIAKALGNPHGYTVREVSLRGNGLQVDAARDIAAALVKGTGLTSLDVSGRAHSIPSRTSRPPKC
jgi:hypothetical protein